MRHWKESSALFVPRFERFELLHRDFRRQPETQQRAAADRGRPVPQARNNEKNTK
jgi:hypothetical protein